MKFGHKRVLKVWVCLAILFAKETRQFPEPQTEDTRTGRVLSTHFSGTNTEGECLASHD